MKRKQQDEEDRRAFENSIPHFEDDITMRTFPKGLEVNDPGGWIQYQWRVCIMGTYHLEETRPNWFRRFWYRALLGWVWEPLETDPDRT